MALAWKAGWVHALAGSNPASSALAGDEQRRAPDSGSAAPSVLRGLKRVSTRLMWRTDQAVDELGDNVSDRVAEYPTGKSLGKIPAGTGHRPVTAGLVPVQSGRMRPGQLDRQPT